MIKQVEFVSTPGLTDYQCAMQIMSERVLAIQDGIQSECVWFLEHPPMYTVGSSLHQTSLATDLPYPIYNAGRGGQITYHGPNQLMGYVMLDLSKRYRDLKRYIHDLEVWITMTLQQIGITVVRRDDRVGLWIEKSQTYDEKIVALGVHVQKWVTSHGFAININPDLKAYQYITPCGISEHGITSCHKQHVLITRQEFELKLQENFSKVFEI